MDLLSDLRTEAKAKQPQQRGREEQEDFPPAVRDNLGQQPICDLRFVAKMDEELLGLKEEDERDQEVDEDGDSSHKRKQKHREEDTEEGDEDKDDSRRGRERNKKSRTEEDSEPTTNAVRVKGLPWTVSSKDVKEFFDGFSIEEGGVYIMYDQSGEGYVEFTNTDDAVRALDRHRKDMGRRYVEVYAAGESEFEDAKEAAKTDGDFAGVVHMKGLPFTATADDIKTFFSKPDLSPDNIHIPFARNGRPNGDAYVVFDTEEEADEAMKLDKEKIGTRWIDLVKATKGEVYSLAAAQGGGSTAIAGFNPGGILKMRGLPYSATPVDIMDFFKDYTLYNPGIFILNNPDGRFSGDAFVAFDTEKTTTEALTRDKEKIGGRWIDLFTVTKSDVVGRAATDHFLEAQIRKDANNTRVVKMRGLPWEATSREVRDFFPGLDIVKVL
jgi:heterogeneous nuclear ribonucleoprotein F/H